MRLNGAGAFASTAAFVLCSMAAAWWTGIADCRLGVGVPVHSCAPWGATVEQLPAEQARAALRMAPLDGTGYRRLAQVEHAAGNGTRAESLYRIALRRAPRDLAVREWLFDRALIAHRMDEAAGQFDALLTLDEASAPARLTASVRLLADPAFRRTLARALLAGRPWRSLLPGVLAHTSRPAEVEALLAEISGSGSSDAETAFHVRLLEQLGRAAEARAVWRAALDPAQRAFDGPIFDGGFEAEPGPAPYAWQLETQGGTAVGVDAAQSKDGARSLAIAFDRRATDFTGVWQDLVLAPGLYRLDMQSKVSLSGRRPVAWVVTCRPSQAPLARLEVGTVDPGWRAYSTVFRVPRDCRGQQLRLLSIGPSLAERSVAGEIRFDSVRIAPVGMAR